MGLYMNAGQIGNGPHLRQFGVGTTRTLHACTMLNLALVHLAEALFENASPNT